MQNSTILRLFIFSFFIFSFSFANAQAPGNCLDFDGTDDYISVSDHADLDFGTGDWTIEFWVKADASDKTIISKNTSGATSPGWRI
ncbi:MAG: hypothetical protein U9R42_12960, partial [Bacteroidota bacterium]|nr:hypothetical protein [Bacteroidota bacterium]